MTTTQDLIAQPPAPSDTAITYMTGYSDGREWAGATSQAQPSQAPQGCACRWDAEDNRIATCTRHQGWLDVVQEWADRAKDAEAKLAQPSQAVELSQQEAEALAHRRASKYAHRSDSSYVAYTFLPHTLMDFVRDVTAAINAKEQPNG